jgi:glycerophosphoryl diester phosphodiesterase
MSTLTKDTIRILKYNRKNAFLFSLAFRLVTTTLYLFVLDRGLMIALKLAGYSYLTVANIGGFLLKPWTIIIMAVLVFFGMLILILETGCFLTLFQGIYYTRKLKPWEILAGGIIKLRDEFLKRNWRLGLLVLANYTLTNLYLIYRFFTHIKPLDFVMSEVLSQPLGKAILILIFILILAAVVPGLYVFHACMVEQKNFKEGYLRSWWLLRHRIPKVLFLLTVYYGAFAVLLKLVYSFCVLITAVAVTLFTDNRLALAILPAACGRIDLVLLFFSSMLLAMGNYGALSVQYFQFSSRALKRTGNISDSGTRLVNKKTALSAISVAVIFSLVTLFHVVYNGSAIAGGILGSVQITAHRGSSKEAPENTMAAIKQAVNDLADFVEIDVQETADGVVVLGHDSSLRRVAGVNRTIGSYSLEELKGLDVGTWFSGDFKGEEIPTLEEVMEYCKGKINLNIEIKSAGDDSLLPEKVALLIDKYQMNEQCVVTSSRFVYLSRIKKLDEKIRTGYIVSAAYGNYYSSDDIDLISLQSSFVTERLVEAAHLKGKAVHAWTVNSKSEMERMKMLSVDNIITDYPVLAREIIYREEAAENLLEYLRLVLK